MSTLAPPRAASLAALATALLFTVVPSALGHQREGNVSPEGQTVVTLGADRVARSHPRSTARRITTIASRRPLTHVPSVVPVLRSLLGSDGVTWLKVQIPGRPNGRKGWITAADTTLSSTPWQLTVRLAARVVEVRSGGQLVRRFRAVVGAPGTPTPRGHFFIEEAVALSSRYSGGPFALATSARSAVLQEFNGGPGQIAMHGTDGLSGRLGSASSHGCVRVSTRAITWLAGRIDAGTPLTVSS